MAITEMSIAVARLTRENTVLSRVCYTNSGFIELEVANSSRYNRILHFEVRNGYTAVKLCGGIVKPSCIKNYRIEITEEIHLVSAAYVVISSLDIDCNGFAVLRGLISYQSNQSMTSHCAV